MLKGLDEIDWGDVEHAYGPATDVPEDLLALASTDPDARSQAFDNLENNINHQGCATPAALVVVPFLVQLVAEPVVQDKARLLVLLADLAVGGGHSSCLAEGYRPLPDDATDELAELVALHQKVAEGWGAYTALLETGGAAERSAALLVLAFLHERAEATAPLVRARLAVEPEDDVRASALLTLGLLAQQLGSKEDLPRLRAACEDERNAALVRLGAAIATGYVAPEECPDDAVRRAVKSPPPSGGAFPWNGGDVRGYAARVLRRLAAARGDVATLIELMEAGDGRERFEVAEDLLSVAFAGEPIWSGYPRRPGSLSQVQRLALERILASNLVLELGPALERRGLFPLAPELSRWLGLSAQGPLDRELDGLPLWLRCRMVLDGKSDVAEWLSMVRNALTPQEIVDLCADAGGGAYRLFQPWPPRSLPQQEMFAADARLAELLIDTLVACSDATHVARYVDELIQGNRSARECAVGSAALSALLRLEGRLLDERCDPVVRTGMFDAFFQPMRQVLNTLPIERRKALILPLDLVHYIERDAFILQRGWLYIDLCPCVEAAEKVIMAVIRSTRFPPPRERAVAALAGTGPVIVPRLQELAGDEQIPHRSIFADALRLIASAAEPGPS